MEIDNEKVDENIMEKRIKINRVNPDNIKPLFVNDLIVTHSDTEFYLTFSLLEPIIFESTDEINEINKIDAIARVRIVITPKFAEALKQAMSNNIDKFNASVKND